jgi:putative Mg2+ transporter-C (MgtC) family protein
MHLAAIGAFDAQGLLDTLVSLTSALLLGTLIGAERQYRQRTAGLRTNALVAVGAAGFVDLAMTLGGADGAVRVLAYVVSGVGFLGAGVIIKDGANIKGLNTAATLWCSAAVGSFAGADRVAEAGLLTAFVLAGNTFLRPLVNWINRAPIAEGAIEATYVVHVTVDDARRDVVREAALELLEAASYPIREVEELAREEETELTARLAVTSVVDRELDEVVARIGRLEGVRHATWESLTSD